MSTGNKKYESLITPNKYFVENQTIIIQDNIYEKKEEKMSLNIL
jgi:hypothetical protein